MATLYIREFGFSNELSDQEAREELQFMTEKLLPAIQKSQGIKSFPCDFCDKAYG